MIILRPDVSEEARALVALVTEISDTIVWYRLEARERRSPDATRLDDAVRAAQTAIEALPESADRAEALRLLGIVWTRADQWLILHAAPEPARLTDLLTDLAAAVCWAAGDADKV